MKTYKQILIDSAKTVWQKKYLWFFGLFAVLFSVTGYEVLISADIEESSNFLSLLWQMELFNIVNWGKGFVRDPLITSLIILFWLFVLSMFLFIIWLSNVSKIALVKNVYRVKEGKSDSLELGVKSGIKYFWPVLFLNLLFVVVVSVVVSILSSPVTLIESELLSFLFFSLISILLSLLVLIFSFVIKFAIAYIVIKEYEVWDAVKKSIKLFVDNWLVNLEMAVILFFLNVAAVVVLFVVVATFGLPFLWVIDFVSNSMEAFAFWLVVGVIVSIFLVVLLFGAIFSTFQVSTWTSLFLELITEGKKSKLNAIFSRKK